METIDNRSFKEKFDDFKGRIAQKFKDFKEWFVANMDAIFTLAIMILPVIGGIIREVNKGRRLNSEQRRRNREIYDPRKGRYYLLKRTPKPWEWEEIDYRYESGENYSSILRDMRLI